MSENTLYKDAMYAKGLADAADLQSRAQEGTADGTAIFEEAEKVPLFADTGTGGTARAMGLVLVKGSEESTAIHPTGDEHLCRG